MINDVLASMDSLKLESSGKLEVVGCLAVCREVLQGAVRQLSELQSRVLDSLIAVKGRVLSDIVVILIREDLISMIDSKWHGLWT